jgi:hypothetical protein
LSEGPQVAHSQHDVAQLAACRDVRVEHRDAGPALLGLMHHVQDISGVTSEPVEPSDDQLVAASQELESSRQFGSASRLTP